MAMASTDYLPFRPLSHTVLTVKEKCHQDLQAINLKCSLKPQISDRTYVYISKTQDCNNDRRAVKCHPVKARILFE